MRPTLTSLSLLWHTEKKLASCSMGCPHICLLLCACTPVNLPRLVTLGQNPPCLLCCSTFAPRSSTAKGKNPAVKGSVLYNVFEVQAWLTLVAGGLLSFNLIFPSDEPDIARLMG